MRWLGAGFAALVLTTACSDDENPTQPTTTTMGAGAGTSAGGGGTGGEGVGGGTGGTADFSAPYDWESRYSPGESAISYSGQTFRQVLIESMKSYIGGLTTQIESNPGFDPSQVVAALDYYYEFDDSTSAMDDHGVSTMPMPLQATWADISSGKNLKGKFAGNDDATDHQDWDQGGFVGWVGATSPEQLLRSWFTQLQDNATLWSNNQIPDDPSGSPLTAVYLTPEGLDLQQLVQKFLVMGVNYAQGTDDYLDDATVDKGLLTANSQDEDSAYSVLGHQWDEGFGYFGAARDYSLYTDEEIAGAGGRDDWQGYHDTNGDGFIDFEAEYNWAASTNAAKRDLGATDATDFTKEAFDAFVAGRELILGAGETLSDAELTELTGHAEAAIAAWEKAIAATVVHYINDTIADTEALGTNSYSFADHAKHFSEMKGFALGLQFNPKSQIETADFAQLHVLMGDAPVVVDGATADAYVTALSQARDIFQSAYGFSAANVEGW